MEFFVGNDISNYTWKEIKEYYSDFCFSCPGFFKDSKSNLLADLLTVQRLYNSYELEIKGKNKAQKDIYKYAIKTLWDYFEEISFDVKKVSEYAKCMNYVVMDYNCGQPIPEDEKKACQVYFPALLNEEDTIHNSMFERILLTELEVLLEAILDNRNYEEPHVAGSSTLPLTEDLIFDELGDKFLDCEKETFSHPVFIKELKAVQNDMLSVLNHNINDARFIQNLRDEYKKKLFYFES